MSSQKADVVIEAVRYAPQGNIHLVRAYVRRSAAFSDRVLLTRSDLLERVEAGQHLVTGRRKAFLGARFDLFLPVRLVKIPGKESALATHSGAAGDELENTPLF